MTIASTATAARRRPAPAGPAPGGAPPTTGVAVDVPTGRRAGMVLTGRGRALLAAGVALVGSGVALGTPEVVAVGLAALLAVVAAVPLVGRRPPLTVVRRLAPDRVTVGGRAHALVEVANAAHRAVGPLAVADHVSTGAGPAGTVTVPIAVPRLRGGEVRRVPFEVPAPRRGRLALGPLVVERTDPLGLVRRRTVAVADGALWVHPRVHRLRVVPVGVELDVEGSVRSAPRGSTTFSSLREYVAGDDVRRIHWPATARTGTPIVRDQIDTSRPRATVVLDRRAAAWAGGAFEHGVEVVASVGVALLRAGDPVVVALGGPARTTHPGDGVVGLLDRLALVGADGDPAASPLNGLGAGAAGGTLVVVTGAGGDGARLAGAARGWSLVVIVELGDTVVAGAERRAGAVALRAPSARVVADAWNRTVGR